MFRDRRRCELARLILADLTLQAVSSELPPVASRWHNFSSLGGIYITVLP